MGKDFGIFFGVTAPADNEGDVNRLQYILNGLCSL
jgi:hypothetical protein